MANFYPGPLGSVEERAGVATAQGGSRPRPTSAKVKKNGIPVSINYIEINLTRDELITPSPLQRLITYTIEIECH